jgi:hypothetical protein
MDFYTDLAAMYLEKALVSIVFLYCLTAIVLFIVDGIKAKKEHRKRKKVFTVMFIIALVIYALAILAVLALIAIMILYFLTYVGLPFWLWIFN